MSLVAILFDHWRAGEGEDGPAQMSGGPPSLKPKGQQHGRMGGSLGISASPEPSFIQWPRTAPPMVRFSGTFRLHRSRRFSRCVSAILSPALIIGSVFVAPRAGLAADSGEYRGMTSLSAVALAPTSPPPDAPTATPAASPPVTPAPTPVTSSIYSPFNAGSGNSTPAMMALPANSSPLAGDTSVNNKFYTITAELRETYDDNVDTSGNGGSQITLETSLTPSILVNFPSASGDFSARYTLGLTYYSNAGGNNGSGGNETGDTLETTHEFVAQYSHSFSDRFSLNAAEQFRYFIEPSLFESTGTPFRSGPYISNELNGVLGAQWTPLFSTSTSYTNTIIRYEEALAAMQQNSVQNTASHSFNYAILPKITASVGGILDEISYQEANRGYTSLTGFVGGQWQVLPSLSVSARGGASYTILVSQSQTLITPYVDISGSWVLGERSSLVFDYSHEITPTDLSSENGQTSDRLSATFSYLISASLSAHLQGILTSSTESEQLSSTANAPNDNEEDDFAVDAELVYHLNSRLDFDAGVRVSEVASDLNGRSYQRDEVYAGVRGTY